MPITKALNLFLGVSPELQATPRVNLPVRSGITVTVGSFDTTSTLEICRGMADLTPLGRYDEINGAAHIYNVGSAAPY